MIMIILHDEAQTPSHHPKCLSPESLLITHNCCNNRMLTDKVAPSYR